MRDWPGRYGLVISVPWNNPPQDYILSWVRSEGKKVALSFFGGRFAVVFNIDWYLGWMGKWN